MVIGLLPLSALCTAASLIGLQWWTILLLEKLKSDGSISDNAVNSGNASQALELLLSSEITIALVVNFALNVFILVILCLKTIFFAKLTASETRKVAERLINYVIYKAAFLPLVLPSTIFHAATWSTWVIVLCTLKMFQALARDRLEQLNASPSSTPRTYFRVYSALLLVLSVDIFWIRICVSIYRSLGSAVFLLLFFEPLGIAFETLQAIMVHGFQLLDMWHRYSAESDASCETSHLLDKLAAGSSWEWKGSLIRNAGFFLDIMTLLMALSHNLNIWWFHGMAFHLVDAVIFLNIRALGGAVIKRVRGFIKLTRALRTLHRALPDASSEELQAYDDECAICREPMAKAKKLSCNHLFHLACLKSWLDQGLSEIYSCPTCRRPLFSRPETNTRSHPGEVLNGERLAQQVNVGQERPAIPGQGLPIGTFSDRPQTTSESFPWRGLNLDSSWTNTGLDGAGPSTAIRSAGLGPVQMMMRHLAAVGDTYAQTTIDDTAWSLWPVTHPNAVPGSSVPSAAETALRFTGRNGGLRFRNVSADNIRSMVDTVREVLPHIPDEIIFQDLQRTNSATVTVNNLLQM